MQTLTEKVVELGLADRLLSDTLLARLFEGSPQRRHNLVNRAMKAGELLRLCRGRYVLNPRFRSAPPHSFALAQAFVPGSYVSFETALSFHGWIPEAVYTTASVTPGRKSAAFGHPIFGSFSFHPLAILPGRFLEMVERMQLGQETMLVAKPARALMDLVCLRKVAWQGMGWLVDGLRIDEDRLHAITPTEIEILHAVYRQKRVKSFLHALARELGLDPGNHS